MDMSDMNKNKNTNYIKSNYWNLKDVIYGILSCMYLDKEQITR